MSTSWLDRLQALAQGQLQLHEGQLLFRAGDTVRSVFVVRSGGLRLERHQPSGDPLVLQRVGPGQLLAEASLFAGRYHCDAVAGEPAVLDRIPKARVLALQEDAEWMRAFAVHLAAEVQRTRARAELLALKRVDARLDAWLTLHGGELPERGRWVEVAAELGVTPEALYRELARRRAPAR